MVKKFTVSLLWICLLPLMGETYYYSQGQKRFLTPLLNTKSLQKNAVNYYLTQTGQKLGVKNEVIVGCKQAQNCSNIFATYPVASIEKLSQTLYLLHLNEGSDPFEVANRLYHEKGILLSHPNFIRERKLR